MLTDLEKRILIDEEDLRGFQNLAGLLGAMS
jgi:hypothetical protein